MFGCERRRSRLSAERLRSMTRLLGSSKECKKVRTDTGLGIPMKGVAGFLLVIGLIALNCGCAKRPDQAVRTRDYERDAEFVVRMFLASQSNALPNEINAISVFDFV